MTLDETMASLYQELAAMSPSQVIRSAAEKFSKAHLASLSIDPDVTGARGAVRYAISLADAARAELLRALAMGDSEDSLGG